MISFHKEDSNLFEYEGTGKFTGLTLIVKSVETKGLDLEDMLANCTITVETSRGNEGPALELGEMPSHIYSAIEEMFQERLRDEADARAEAMSECDPDEHISRTGDE